LAKGADICTIAKVVKALLNLAFSYLGDLRWQMHQRTICVEIPTEKESEQFLNALESIY